MMGIHVGIVQRWSSGTVLGLYMEMILGIPCLVAQARAAATNPACRQEGVQASWLPARKFGEQIVASQCFDVL